MLESEKLERARPVITAGCYRSSVYLYHTGILIQSGPMESRTRHADGNTLRKRECVTCDRTEEARNVYGRARAPVSTLARSVLLCYILAFL